MYWHARLLRARGLRLVLALVLLCEYGALAGLDDAGAADGVSTPPDAADVAPAPGVRGPARAAPPGRGRTALDETATDALGAVVADAAPAPQAAEVGEHHVESFWTRALRAGVPLVEFRQSASPRHEAGRPLVLAGGARRFRPLVLWRDTGTFEGDDGGGFLDRSPAALRGRGHPAVAPESRESYAPVTWGAHVSSAPAPSWPLRR